MINIAIVEDHAPSAALLEQYINRYATEKNVKDLHITVFGKGGQFLIASKTTYFDIMFFDIGLPDINGMRIAEEIRKSDANGIIIFVTDMAQFAVKGYKVDALDYIVKPVIYKNFVQVMQRAISRLDRSSELKLTIKTDGGMARLSVGDIRYVEVLNHKLIYHTGEGIVDCYGQLNDVEGTLTAAGFVQVSRFCLVNLRYIKSIEDCTVDVDGEKLQVSVRRRREVLERIAEFFGE